MSRNESLSDLAGEILDGTPIDWPSVERAAGNDDSDLLDELRLISAVADLHRQLQVPSPGDWADNRGMPPAGEAAYWGRLRLLERIGAGTFGEVYRAWDPRLHREVALKLIPVRGGADDRAASVIHEGRLLARVRHPAVVTIFDAEQIGSRVGLCMELVPGCTLEQRLVERGVFEAGEAAAIGAALCSALSAVHAAGLLHRDIKASNVVMADDGRIVLMDFGAGKELRDATTDGVAAGPSADDVTGTPLYVAPEVLGGEPATIRSDVYGLGVLLYHIVTGTYPVTARSVDDLRLAHERRATEGRLSVRTMRPDLPERLGAAIDRAIEPRPEDRYESALALGERIAAARPATSSRGWIAAAAVLAITLAAAAVSPPVRGWLSRGSGSTSPGMPPIRIAVLPFSISGEEPEAQVLRAGMAQDLIARLERYDNARIISKASAFSAGHPDVPLREVGARLGVETILTGDMERGRESITVAARLVRLPDERVLWSDRYTRPLRERVALQQDIASAVAAELRLHDQNTASRWPTDDPTAYSYYVQGRAMLDRFTAQGQRLALPLFEKALSIDPSYAQAHAGVAEVFLQMSTGFTGVSSAEAVRRAANASALALSIDESLPEAHVADALVRSARADWDGAERAFRRALELGPGNAQVHLQFAHWLSLHGRSPEALEHALLGVSLDPLSTRAIMGAASALRFAGRLEEGITYSEKALELDPDHRVAYLNLGHCYQGLGRLDEAIAAFGKYGRNGNLGHALAQAGRTRDALELVRSFEEEYAKTGLWAGHIAQIYTGLGDLDKAFMWLERAEAVQPPWPNTLKVAPVWDPLRSDPRFTELLRRRGLADR